VYCYYLQSQISASYGNQRNPAGSHGCCAHVFCDWDKSSREQIRQAKQIMSPQARCPTAWTFYTKRMGNRSVQYKPNMAIRQSCKLGYKEQTKQKQDKQTTQTRTHKKQEHQQQRRRRRSNKNTANDNTAYNCIGRNLSERERITFLARGQRLA